MAGHSHSANIAIRKGAQDKKRGKLFGKLSRAIIVAARNGGGDPTSNLSLRYALDKARKNSMPKENIERAVKKGTGESGDEQYEEMVYEGYAPGGVAVLCDILTENRNRTAGEVREVFKVHGGNLGSTGCVGYLFTRKGVFVVPAQNVDEDRLFEIVLEAGGDDVRKVGESFEITCEVSLFQQLNEVLEAAKIPTDVAELQRISSTTVEVDVETGKLVMEFIEALEDLDDIQTVTTNVNLPDELTSA
ncbi:MAG: YebC/PmpR family DNA-binding transcriptional regulator [Planctomycetota bacterium]|nr:MAG: YebC/PmpR family DNA-binding transcriptional regulator [Planctomycetota bacterium]GDY09329.1 putative transcriptional regulatory protein [Planctomycetia bacterium]